MPSLPVRSCPSRRAFRAASISNVGLVISHYFLSNNKEMTQNSEHYREAQITSMQRVLDYFEITVYSKFDILPINAYQQD